MHSLYRVVSTFRILFAKHLYNGVRSSLMRNTSIFLSSFNRLPVLAIVLVLDCIVLAKFLIHLTKASWNALHVFLLNGTSPPPKDCCKKSHLVGSHILRIVLHHNDSNIRRLAVRSSPRFGPFYSIPRSALFCGGRDNP